MSDCLVRVLTTQVQTLDDQSHWWLVVVVSWCWNRPFSAGVSQNDQLKFNTNTLSQWQPLKLPQDEHDVLCRRILVTRHAGALCTAWICQKGRQKCRTIVFDISTRWHISDVCMRRHGTLYCQPSTLCAMIIWVSFPFRRSHNEWRWWLQMTEDDRRTHRPNQLLLQLLLGKGKRGYV